MTGTRAERLRSRLDHPVVDADGHWLEPGAAVRARMRQIGGDLAVEGFSSFAELSERVASMPMDERWRRRVPNGGWWLIPADTRDRATVMFPRLLRERMSEMGLDYCVLFPSTGVTLARIPDERMRRIACRAFNVFSAEYFAGVSDRMTPAAVIPMHSPEEAVEELEHAVTQLGLKVVLLGSLIPRMSETIDARSDVPTNPRWVDVLGIDSAHDYDPVWAKCVELGVSPSFHQGSRHLGLRGVPTNYVYNHIGHFAAAHEAVCKALFLGGVTRRFPTLRFAFLEGGVGWACQLFADLVGHWEKRSASGLRAVDPARLDEGLFAELAKRYAGDAIARGLAGTDAMLDVLTTPRGAFLTSGNESIDDYAACAVESARELRELFVDRFWFGCEADDRMNALAFDHKYLPFDARLNAMFGSDIGHFDVPDISHVLPEAYELVEHGLMHPHDFRDFMFANAVRFWGAGNPRFFEGTAIATEAKALL
jgi:predicted TIM-barrel fold metal-dependent hydrolase